MLLLSHIIVAVTSLIFSSLALMSPTKQKIRIGYLFSILVLISGVGLVIQKPQSLTLACIEGVIYLTIVFSLNFFAYKKLSYVQNIARIR